MAEDQALSHLAWAHLAALVESSDDAIISQTLGSIVTSWNSAAERLFGYTAAETIGHSIDRFLPEDRLREERAILERIRLGERVKHFETARLRRDGTEVSVSLSISPILDAAGAIVGASKIARDVSVERAERERMLQLSAKAQHLAALVESSDDAIVSTTVGGVVTSWNGGAEKIFGYAAAQMLGHSIRRLLPADREEEAAEILRRVIAGERVGPFETRRLRSDGSAVDVSLSNSPIRAEDGRIIGISKIARDIGERLEAERRIAHEAAHDSLTGLSNRRALREALAEAVRRAHAHHAAFAVLYVDLDGFKDVNDTLGHEAGDQLLVEAARRFREVLRPGDVVARIGGDEFVVLADRVRSADEAVELGTRLTAVLRMPVQGSVRTVSGSIGVAMYPSHGHTPDDLLRHADRGLYAAKRQGRDRVVIYCEDATA
jgi:diguanylate cyclase (GGDEF)-like protein/PAS domain S-box-containing protein